MAAMVLEIADAVVTAINAATAFTLPAPAARAYYVPVFDVKDLTALRVVVVPRDLSLAPANRHADDYTYNIDVGIQVRADGTPAQTDPYMLLAEQVVDVFRGKPLGTTGATCTGAANAPIFDPGHLDQHGVFTSVITLTFTLPARARP